MYKISYVCDKGSNLVAASFVVQNSLKYIRQQKQWKSSQVTEMLDKITRSTDVRFNGNFSQC